MTGVNAEAPSANVHVPTLPVWFPSTVRLARSVFPTLPYRWLENGRLLAGTQTGTAFFLDHAGHFVTARHVVEDLDDDPVRSVLLIVDGRLHVAPVEFIARHPTADIAVGRVAIPEDPAFHPIPLAIDIREPAEGARVVAYGFPDTRVEEDGPDGDRRLVLDFTPTASEGVVLGYHREGRGVTKWPLFSTTCTTRGGISGGPLLSDSGGVHGVACTGFDDGYGTYTDARLVFDLIQIVSARAIAR